jgi:cytochrome c556
LTAAALGSLAACGGGASDENTAETGDSAATADTDTAGVIEERQANFEAIGDAFKAIRGQMEGGAPDLAIVEAQATDINTRAQKVADHFPAGTSVDDGVKTEALAAIWEKPEEFAAASQKLVDTSGALITAAASGDAAAVGEGIKAMGGSCKNCHDNFRLDTD